MSRADRKYPARRKDDPKEPDEAKGRTGDNEIPPPNPPRTTIGKWFTAPKFGSAGSGGAEIDPGPERD